MANLKQRLRRKNSDGSYDIIYLQADMSNVTGTLGVSNGGTGATTASAALTSLGAAAASHGHVGTEINCYGSTVEAHVADLWTHVNWIKSVVNVRVDGFDSNTGTLSLVPMNFG